MVIFNFNNFYYNALDRGLTPALKFAGALCMAQNETLIIKVFVFFKATLFIELINK